MFFILLSGWSMFYLLQKHFLKDKTIAVILACCYMLSGFTVGSAQWMLYITAAAFTPLVFSSLLQLLKLPSFQNALLFSVLYFIMFTSVYPAFTIIVTYCFFFFTVFKILDRRIEKAKKIAHLKYLGLAGAIALLMCLPCIVSTLEVLKFMSRGKPLLPTSQFFNSNYLPPSSLSSILFPFSSAKMYFANTEPTMFNSYTGLFSLLIFPFAIIKTIKEKNRFVFIILLIAIFFLLISFGSILPIRNMLNIFPGFSYFRNPGLFRFYFIFFFLIYLAQVFHNSSWQDIFDLKKKIYSKYLKFGFLILILACIVYLLTYFKAAKTISFSNLQQLVKNISYQQTILINAVLQIVFLIAIFFSSLANKYQFTKFFIIIELIINTLLCTPYFVVSSYTLPQVNAILQSEKGFPLQKLKVGEVNATYTDEKSNKWANVNIFLKQVSVNESYRGPLLLKNFSRYAEDSTTFKSASDHPIVFINSDSSLNNENIKLIIQKPTHIRIEVNTPKAATITVMQNYFPGWKVYYNNKKVDLINVDRIGLTANIPLGRGMVDFIYSKPRMWISALILHLIVISFVGYYMYTGIKKRIKFS
jgi:hypothetical protein